MPSDDRDGNVHHDDDDRGAQDANGHDANGYDDRVNENVLDENAHDCKRNRRLLAKS